MKRSVLFLVAAAIGFTVTPDVQAQTNDDLIEQALAAAPRRAQEGAAVIKWNADHTYETLKEGSNRIVCYSRADETRRRPFAVQCTSAGNLERVAQSRRFRAEAADAEAERALIEAAEADGTRIAPEFGSVFISMNGDDQASAGTHRTIAVPGATPDSLGLPDNPAEGGAWIMSAGTTTAHIMVPGT